MKKLILVFLVLFSTSTCFGAFGGSRSSGSFSSGSRSSSSFGGSRSYSAPSYSAPRSTFGGSRSSGQPATITRPPPQAPRTIYQGSPVIHETVIHHESSWIPNWMMWNMMQPRSEVVVVPGMQGSVMAQPVVVEYRHGFLYYLVWTIVLFCVVMFVWKMIELLKEE